MKKLLRCELQGARADLSDNQKRAVAEAAAVAEGAKERERALQTRMGARLQAAEYEIAAVTKRMVDYKR